MTNQEILTKAIQKALDNGWNGNFLGLLDVKRMGQGKHLRIVNNLGEEWSIEEIIFNHNFAKTLWGKEPGNYLFALPGIPLWQHHLQQMVISDDPIKYLGEHLDD